MTPKVVVGDTTCIGLKSQYGGYFSHDFLSVLIARKAGLATAPADTSKTPKEAFEKIFKINTPETYESMPDRVTIKVNAPAKIGGRNRSSLHW